MSPQGHYHVDVFRADRRFVRALTLQRVGETALYRVCDDSQKPIAPVRQRNPAWLRDLTFAFDVLFRVFEAAPGGSPVADVRFENPPSGFVFVESDLVPRGPDLATACAEAAIGNKVEYGRIVVNGSALPFRCDCGAQVDLWMGLPRAGAWLTRAALREIAADAARRHGAPIAE